MKLVSFSADKFRSIRKAYKIPISAGTTVLVGPNNEGKSNLLKAFSLGMELLLGDTESFSRYRPRYQWSDDFPMDLQQTMPNGISKFEYEFELNQSEKNAFLRITGSNWESSLKIQVSFGQKRPTVEIKTKGKAKKSINEKKEKILDFLNKHLIFQSIPAVRTPDITQRLASRLIYQDLETKKKTLRYLELQGEIDEIESSVFADLSEKTASTLKDFSIGSRKVYFAKTRQRHFSSDSIELHLEDKVRTPLSEKGDGIQSLVAIALMVLTSELNAKGKSRFCSIEEPESHLHPKAIHDVSRALQKISENVQTLISTHSPILINRDRLSGNIIVDGGRAYEANSIAELREVLGIERADNLSQTRVVLLCEGEGDRQILHEWLQGSSTLIAKALANEVLDIVPMHGVSNLEYQINVYKSQLCAFHVFADFDSSGRQSVQKAVENRRLGPTEYTFARLTSSKESELEDLISVDAYRNLLMADYGFDLTKGEFKNKARKWSERLADVAKASAKELFPSVEKEIKKKIADLMVSSGVQHVKPEAKPVLDNLVAALEAKLSD